MTFCSSRWHCTKRAQRRRLDQVRKWGDDKALGEPCRRPRGSFGSSNAPSAVTASRHRLPSQEERSRTSGRSIGCPRDVLREASGHLSVQLVTMGSSTHLAARLNENLEINLT